jgi:hypothetical protein
VPWKPASIRAAAFAAGCLLSLWTSGGDDAPAPQAPVEARPAPAAVPSCPPGPPVLVPDVVLSADPVAAAPPTGEAIEAIEAIDEPLRKAPRRKAKSRRGKQAGDARIDL